MITAIIISAIAGATVGYTIAAVLMIGRRSEPKKNIPKKEPTRLFTVGSVVNWKGAIGEIESLWVSKKDNQTYARIKNGQRMVTYNALIEELEGVGE